MFKVWCNIYHLQPPLERRVLHLQMITLRASGLALFKNQQEMGAKPDFCRNDWCLHHPTWKLLPQTLP